MATLVDQLRGTTKLALEATRAVTDLVEEMHHVIGGGPEVLGRPFLELTKLLSSPTYSSIRGVTSLVGAGLELALQALQPMLARAGADRGLLLAVLNGVLGDSLAATNNPLAVPMELRADGRALELTRDALGSRFPSGERLLVLVHGSSADDGAWKRRGHDHGEVLARERGLVPVDSALGKDVKPERTLQFDEAFIAYGAGPRALRTRGEVRGESGALLTHGPASMPPSTPPSTPPSVPASTLRPQPAERYAATSAMDCSESWSCGGIIPNFHPCTTAITTLRCVDQHSPASGPAR